MTYVFNTTIAVPSELPAQFKMIAISESDAVKELSVDFVSAVGHQATAQALSELLGINVPMNRIQAAMQTGDKAVCFKLRGRLPEGVILDRAGVEAIGYDLVLMERIS